MDQRRSPLAWILVVALVAVVVGCKKPPETTPSPTPPPPAPAAEATPPEPPPDRRTEVTESFPTEPVETGRLAEPTAEELNRRGVLETIYFAFDSYDLDDDARATLRNNAEWLAEHPGHTLRVEGHCDERGTIEYNLALGERRASAVRDYLVGLGIDAGRVRIVSFGEERPEDPRHNEEAWSKNRRAEFVLES